MVELAFLLLIAYIVLDYMANGPRQFESDSLMYLIRNGKCMEYDRMLICQILYVLGIRG